MARIFVSYRHVDPDQGVAAFLYRHLSDQDHEVFLDRDGLKSGALWHKEIANRLEQSDWFIPLVSLAYLNSRYIVDHELVPAAARFRRGELKGFLPANLAYDGEPPDVVADVVRQVQSYKWRGEADTLPLVHHMAELIPPAQTLIKGMRAFKETDAELFQALGRQPDVARFLGVLQGDGDGTTCVQIHGVSGAGKTSFIRAGVLPRLVDQAEVVELDYREAGSLATIGVPPRYLFLDQFDSTLLALSRDSTLLSAFVAEFLSWSGAHPKTTVIFCIRDEFRTAFDVMLPSISQACSRFSLLPFEPTVAATVLGALLRNAQIEHDPVFIRSLCDEIAEGVPRAVTPAILQLIAQYLSNHNLAANKGTWDQLVVQRHLLFVDHLRSAVVDRLQPRVAELDIVRTLSALTIGDVKSPARTARAIAEQQGLPARAVDETLDLCLQPHARVVRLETESDREHAYRLVHDLFAPAVHSVEREIVRRRERQGMLRRWWLMGSATTAGLLIVALLIVFGVRLYQQQNVERSQRLSARSTSLLSFDPELGLLLAVEAATAADTPEAVDALRVALTQQHGQWVSETYPEGVLAIAFSPDGKVIATGAGDNAVRIHDPATGRVLAVLEAHRDRRESSRTSGGDIVTSTTSGVHTLAFDSTGQYLLTGGEDGEVFVWDWRSEDRIATGTRHLKGVRKAVFLGRGDRIFTLGADATIRLWDWESIRSSFELRDLAGIGDGMAAVSQDGALVAGTRRGDQHVSLWDTASGSREQLGDAPFHVAEICISPDNRFVMASDYDGNVSVWSVDSKKHVAELKGHTAAVNAIAFSRDGRHAVTVSDDLTGRVWDVQSWKTTRVLIGHTAQVEGVAVSEDGNFIITRSADKTVRVWLTSTGASVGVLRGQTESARDVAVSPDGRSIAAGDDQALRMWRIDNPARLLTETRTAQLNYDGTLIAAAGTNAITISETTAGRQRAAIAIDVASQLGGVDSLTFSRDNGYVLVKGQSAVALWEWNLPRSETNPRLFSVGLVDVARLSPDGRYLVTAGMFEPTLTIRETETGSRTTVSVQGVRGNVEFSDDGRFLAAGSSAYKIRVWASGTWELIHELDASMNPGERQITQTIAISPDGASIVANAADGTWRVWDGTSGSLRCTLNGLNERGRIITFASDSQSFAFAGFDGAALVWDTQTCSPVIELRGHTDQLWTIAFSPNGRFIATGSHDRTIRVWDAETGRAVWQPQGHSGIVNRIAFGPDSRTLVTSSANDDMSLVLDCKVCTSVTDLLDLAGTKTSRRLTEAERLTYGR